MKKGTP